METKTHFYVWRWVGGGYNTCRAENRTKALKVAREMGLPSRFAGGMTVTLTVNESTLHIARKGEVEALDREYASLFY